jgi:hypothetical protein
VQISFTRHRKPGITRWNLTGRSATVPSAASFAFPPPPAHLAFISATTDPARVSKILLLQFFAGFKIFENLKVA